MQGTRASRRAAQTKDCQTRRPNQRSAGLAAAQHGTEAMIVRNGRKIIGSLEAIVDNYVVVVAENEKLKRELAQSQRMQAELVAERDALWKELKYMQDEMRRM